MLLCFHTGLSVGKEMVKHTHSLILRVACVCVAKDSSGLCTPLVSDYLLDLTKKS